MQIKEIIVKAGRTFNHPHEQYSNLKPEVELRATIEDGDIPEECVQKLQAKAEGLVEDHKQGLLKSIKELYQLTQRQAEVQGLQKTLQQAQERMEQIRREFPDVKLLPNSDEQGNDVPFQ
jgi:predicted RNase H-like nuclease (RuvC/YqgF family)